MKILPLAGWLLLFCWSNILCVAQAPIGIPSPAGKIDSVRGMFATKIDSVPGTIRKQLNNTRSELMTPFKQLPLPGDSQLVKNMKQMGKAQLDSVMGLVKAPLQQLTGGVKLFEGGKPFSVNQLNAEVDYTYVQDTAGIGSGIFSNSQGIFGYTVNYGVGLANMPFTMSIRENNGINTMNYTPFQNFYQFNFDHDQYLETLRSQLMAKLGPEAIMNSALSRVKTIRTQYEQQLQGEITHIQESYQQQYKSSLNLPAGATSLSTNDLTSLRTRLLPADAMQKYQRAQDRLQNMIQHKDPKTLASDTAYLKTLGEVKKYEETEKVFSKIVDWKQRFEDNPLVKMLRSQSSFSTGSIKAYLSDPSNLGQVLDDQASLSTMQRLFVNIKQLNLGQNAVQSGELNMQNVVNTGINTEFQNRTTSVGMIYGQNNAVNNWQQAGLTSQVSNYTNVTGFKLGSGSGSSIDQSLSFNFFNTNNAPGGAGSPGNSSSFLPVAPHQDGVISLHTGFQLGGSHMITLDASRSFGSFNQGVTTDSSGKTASNGSLFSNSGKANYAGILNYTGELFKTDLKLYLKLVGLGYNNPGNTLLRSGQDEVGIGLARKFWQNRISLKYEGDYRRQAFDPSGNFVYTSYSNKLQAGYKIDRNDRINLTYQRSDYRSDFYGQASTTGLNSRLQLDGSYRFLVDGKKVMNNITISQQQTSIPLTMGGTYVNSSVLVTNTSSFMVNKNLLSITLLTNQSNNKTYYFNTSMSSAEANYSYSLSGLGKMSSGLGYYDNYGWNQQVGIRQQISAVIKEKINLDLQGGYKKAIVIIQPQLANQLFVTATVRYTFK